MTRILLALSLALAATACRSTPDEVRIEALLRRGLSTDLAADREVVMSRVEIPPNTTLPWHWHPGEEFAYVLEGELTAHFEDGDDVRLTENEAGHIPFHAVHTATAGPRGARLLVVRVHMSGQPERHMVDAPYGHAHVR